MAWPPVDTSKQVGFTRRIFVLQSERVTKLLKNCTKLQRTNKNITLRPKCKSYKLFLQFRTPLDGNRCRFCRATTRTAWQRPADPLGHRRPTPDNRRCDTKPVSSTFQTLVDIQPSLTYGVCFFSLEYSPAHSLKWRQTSTCKPCTINHGLRSKLVFSFSFFYEK
jgi:hypothetical protein